MLLPVTQYNGTSGSCQQKDYSPKSIKVNFTYVNQSDAALIQAVAVAPVAATIQVSTTAAGDFFYYSSGIMNATNPDICGPSTNHAILVTGYGVNATTGQAYWIIKNRYMQGRIGRVGWGAGSTPPLPISTPPLLLEKRKWGGSGFRTPLRRM